MSTRAVIARSLGDNHFVGRYHHQDGYPSGLGRALYRLYHKVFDGDLDRMQRTLLDEPQAGWSLLGVGDSLFSDHYREEEGEELNEERAAEWFCNYAYVLTRQPEGDATMRILQLSYSLKEDKGTWVPLADVPLDQPAPDWDALDRAAS